MRWYGGSIVEAINLSKSKNAIFVVYVEGTDAQSKEMTELLNTPEVSSRLNVEENFVPIKLVSGSQAYTQFAQIYQLVPIPSLFFIGSSGTPIDVVAGSVSGGVPDLTARIDVLMAHRVNAGRQQGLSQASTSGRSSARDGSTAFIASEQGQAAKATEKPAMEKIADDIKSSSAEVKIEKPPLEFDLVCEGEVCVRRPRQPNVDVTEQGDTSSTSISAQITPEPVPVIPSVEARQNLAPTTETIQNTAAPAAEAKQNPAPSSSSTETSPTPSSSESEAVASSAAMSIEERVERAKELLELKKREKEEEEKKAEREKELARRAQGQGLAELKKWQQEQELKSLREERLKEKKENAKIKARILEQIAQDRADRHARYGSQEAPKPVSPTTAQPPSPIVDNSHITRLQFKMPDGSTHVTQVESTSTLGELRQYVRDNILPSSSFTLATMYPRHFLLEEDDNKSMRALGLSPSSALLLLKGENITVVTGGSSPPPVATNINGFFNMLTQIFWSFVVTPAQDLFSYISNLITGQRARGRSSPEAGTSADRSQNRRPPQSGSTVKKRRLSGEGGSSDGTSTVRRDGNTYRLRDPRDSDDENSTWNGNSTQQM